jgi:NhaP-type Na+/H+ or K+/H+ antiporter
MATLSIYTKTNDAISGANDGLGYPFLFLAIYLIQIPSIGKALSVWTLHVMIYEILLSIVIGFVAGFMAKNMLRFAEEK